MVGLQTLDLAIGVRVPASQPLEVKNDQGRFVILPNKFAATARLWFQFTIGKLMVPIWFSSSEHID